MTIDVCVKGSYEMLFYIEALMNSLIILAAAHYAFVLFSRG
jgi:hypothetical protein